MTIGELIKQFREKNGLSQRQFALKCSVSNGYISMLEKGKNPNTNEPIMPSVAALKAIAAAMGMSLNELITKADDMPVNLSNELEPSVKFDDDLTAEMLSIFRTYTPEQKKLLLSLMKGILPEE